MAYPPAYMFDLQETIVMPDRTVIPGTRQALERLLQRNPDAALGILSAAQTDKTIEVLEQAGLIHLFPREKLIVSMTDGLRLTPSIRKDEEVFRELHTYLWQMCHRICATYTDDTRNHAVKAVASGKVFGNIYHLDRRSGLTAPVQEEGYIRIASLDQMREMTR